MHSAVSLIFENVAKHSQLLVPLLFSTFAAIANVHTPVQHSLLVTSVSWLLLCIPIILRVGVRSNGSKISRKTACFAGAFLALSGIFDRAACDKQGIWVTKALLPLFTILIAEHELLAKHFALPLYTSLNEPETKATAPSEAQPHIGSYRLLASMTIAAGVVLAIYTTSATSVIGFSSVVVTAIGFVLFENALRGSTNDDEETSHGPELASGRLPGKSSLIALRDIAAVHATLCGIASWIMEPSMGMTSIAWDPTYKTYLQGWKTVHGSRVLQLVLWAIPGNVIFNVLMSVMILQHGAVHTSFLSLFSFMCAKLRLAPSFLSIWFTFIFGASSFLYSTAASSSSPVLDLRNSIRIRRSIFGIMLASLAYLCIRYALDFHSSLSTGASFSVPIVQPASPFEPIPMDLTKGHPASQLIAAAETDFEKILKQQSTSLAEASTEYRRRYGIAPPPNFDKWYEFAKRNGVVMIDEFDSIGETLLPFWAVKPTTLRSRVANALGHEDSAMVAVSIRDGAVKNLEGGDEWQQQATIGMMKDFVQYLPDMDLGFNVHDEPRVIVPNNLMESMLAKAKNEVLPRVAGTASPRNSFSARPKDLNDGSRFEETSTTRFNRFAHQQTWTHSRLSCPANSQAQTFEDYAPDNLTAYAASPLQYIYDATAFSDICNTPSFSSTFGFFERPNAFNIIHELTPVFSQSKISSFQDILYPSPWYWVGKVGYDEGRDTTWENKTNSLFWRGSTTGGFSRNGGWRRQHRQHIVQRLNAPDTAQVLDPESSQLGKDEVAKTFSVKEIERRSLKHLIDVKFSHVGQCDPGDCAAQKEFFKVTERVDGQDAWYHKHLLDMDGNAFSGRFYSFLKSRSLTYKMAVFQEWHSEWLKPWVHYIPISLRGDEHLDLIRWFSGDVTTEDEVKSKKEKVADKGGNGKSEGETKAREIAERSTEWHDKVLRNVDFEAWLFRLLLEYGRIVDDDRENVGYPGP